MKAWRNESAANINARRAAGSKESKARSQMQEGQMLSKMFPMKSAGNWLLDGLLYRNGYLKPQVAFPNQVEEDFMDAGKPGSELVLSIASSMPFFSRLKQALGM